MEEGEEEVGTREGEELRAQEEGGPE